MSSENPNSAIKPLYIKVHESDNVAIIVNSNGLPADSVFPDGLVLKEHVPQGHKVALVDLAQEAPIVRYGEIIGYAVKPIVKGAWIEGIPGSSAGRPGARYSVAGHQRYHPRFCRFDGYTFEGYRNADGSVGTKNLLAITTSVQCVAGVVDYVVKRIKAELLRKYPNVDGVIGLNHIYGCGVAINAPAAIVPIRTIHNLALNPNFGNEVMVVSLGCEKLTPERLLNEGGAHGIPIKVVSNDVICLQDEKFTGFMSMADAIMKQAEVRLVRLNQRRRELSQRPIWSSACSVAAATPSPALPPTRR